MIKTYDYQKIRDRSLQGPRVTTLFPHFEQIAEGLKQQISTPLKVAPQFLERDEETPKYFALLGPNVGTFTKHFCGSVPLSLEERCRMGLAICRYARLRVEQGREFLTYYETSSTDGTDSRTMTEYVGGIIRTLTDSPNKANQRNFYSMRRNNFSNYNLGPFVDVTPELLATHPDWDDLRNGFDIIHENATFQFYGPEREEQIAYLKRLLKPDGIMMFKEKFNHPDPLEYQRREEIKDKHHKSTYFSAEAIGWKKTNMLEDMEKGQVTLDELLEAIKVHFKYAYISWNSTNFYKVVCSNDYDSIQQFIKFLGQPYTPPPFQCDTDVPRFIQF